MPKWNEPHAAFQEGAEAERRAIRAYLKRQIKAHAGDDCRDFLPVTRETLDMVLEWLNKRDERTAKRKGGVGRK